MTDDEGLFFIGLIGFMVGLAAMWMLITMQGWNIPANPYAPINQNPCPEICEAHNTTYVDEYSAETCRCVADNEFKFYVKDRKET
jgi:hypothetical protein